MFKKTIAVFTVFLVLATVTNTLWPPDQYTLYHPQRLISLAQAQQFVVAQPDCQIFFAFTATGQTSPTSPNAGLDNRTLGCDTWNVTYSNSGFSAVSLAIQGAANNAGVPGSYSNGFQVQQSILSGSNPQTSTTGGFMWAVGYSPWVRITLGSSTGSGVVNGAAYGWRIPSAGAASTATQDVNVAEWGGSATSLGQKTMANSVPVVIASDQSSIQIQGQQANGAALSGNPVAVAYRNSTGAVVPEYGSSQSVITLSASGSTQIIAASGSTQIRVTHISFQTDGAQDLSILSGTGSNCGTNTTTVAGPYDTTTGLYLDFVAGPLTLTAGHALCINQSSMQNGGGVVIYTQR